MFMKRRSGFTHYPFDGEIVIQHLVCETYYCTWAQSVEYFICSYERFLFFDENIKDKFYSKNLISLFKTL